jgi:LPXTG-motif cell wall-anchored protein
MARNREPFSGLGFALNEKPWRKIVIPRNLIFVIAAILVASFSVSLLAEGLTDVAKARQVVTAQANGPAVQPVADFQTDGTDTTQENAQLPGTGSDWFGYVVAGALLLVLAGFFKKSVEQG